MRRDPKGLLHPARLDDHGTCRHRPRLPTGREMPAPEQHVRFAAQWRGALRRVREHPAVVLAAGAMLVSGALLLHWLSRLTFWRDEWGFLLHRRGWGVATFLDPAVEHLSTIPILLYKAQLEIFGMAARRARTRSVAVVGFLASVALLFLYVRPGVGEWLALAAILPDSLPRPIMGRPALPVPDRILRIGGLRARRHCSASTGRGRRRDAAATVLLTAGLLFSDAGLPFVAAAAVSVGLDPARLRRAQRRRRSGGALAGLVRRLGPHSEHLRLPPQRGRTVRATSWME